MKYIFIFLTLFFANEIKAQFENLDCNKTIVTINSSHLNQERELWVGLPNNFDSTVTYPTIYLLDAEDHFDITYALINELANNDKMPKHILIGIPKINDIRRWKDLSFSTENPIHYDLTIAPEFFNNPENLGGGGNFLRYIENELIPFVNKNYKTNDYNILIGHSLSGYFGAYSIPIQKSFSAFQLYDPSVFCNSNEAISNIENNLKSDYSANIFISSALAKKEGDPIGKKVALNAIDTLIEKISNYPEIRLSSKFYTDEGHLSMFMYSIIDGFTFLYEGFEFGYILPTMNVSIEDYSAHYKKLSKTTGFNFSPPMAGIRWVAYANHHQNKWSKAIEAYLICESYFIDDYQVNLEIAECYLNLNEIQLSLKYYNICNNLNPDIKEISEKIKELEIKLKN